VWQRADSANGHLWRQYCDQHGDGTYDPSRHTASFLKSALARLNPSSQPPRRSNQRTRTRGMSLSQLIEEIKNWQRQSLPNSIAWRQYCQDHGDGSYDPTRYDSDFLEAAIAALYNGAEEANLVERVKNIQRSGNGDAWREYCDTHGEGNYDPERHDERFLQRALAALGSNQESRHQGNQESRHQVGGNVRNISGNLGGNLTEKVKELQRSHKEAAERWKEHCESEGDGTYDPSRYEAPFLKNWLAQMQSEGW